MWNKAAELIKTEGAIVATPGMGLSTKFGMSYSSKKAHLVTPKKEEPFRVTLRLS